MIKVFTHEEEGRIYYVHLDDNFENPSGLTIQDNKISGMDFSKTEILRLAQIAIDYDIISKEDLED